MRAKGEGEGRRGHFGYTVKVSEPLPRVKLGHAEAVRSSTSRCGAVPTGLLGDLFAFSSIATSLRSTTITRLSRAIQPANAPRCGGGKICCVDDDDDVIF